MIKKGYTMLDMLICISIISTLVLLSLNRNSNIDLSHYEFMNGYLLNQSKALLDCESIQYEKGVSFNCLGHVNKANTIEFENNHRVIIHLGSGYITYE